MVNSKSLSWSPINIAALTLIPAISWVWTIWLFWDNAYSNVILRDPTYAYYLSTLRILDEGTPGLIEHPGIPFQ